MLVMMDETRTPTHWALRNHNSVLPLTANGAPGADRINIALINNMPDAALEDTESQFFELLNSVAGNIPVRLTLYSLPGIPRGDRGKGTAPLRSNRGGGLRSDRHLWRHGGARLRHPLHRGPGG